MGPTNLRQANQRAVLTIISIMPGCSNADIARRTGLAPQSVSAVLADLDELGLLTRGEARRGGGRGQPATPLFVNAQGAYAIGVSIGWSRLEVVLLDLDTHIIHSERLDYAYPDATTILVSLQRMIDAACAAIPDRSRIIGLGLAAPSDIGDPDSPIQLPEEQSILWRTIDLVDELARISGLEVLLVNDGNAACWAEFVAMPTPRPGNFVYIFVDALVGAGIVAEDRLWEGAGGKSGNLGAMLVTDTDGALRFVYEVASLNALRRRLGARGYGLSAAVATTQQPEAAEILAAWIGDAAFSLAQAILNTRTILEFEFAVMDVELPAPIAERLLSAVRNQLLKVRSLEPPPDVRAGHFGHPHAAHGAAFIRLYRRFFSRELAHLD
jgi:predicted NBD/HSP70 family sugar kinase